MCEIARMLQQTRNLCVVGDMDSSLPVSMELFNAGVVLD